MNRWYDYLATVPSLGEFLARTTTGYEVLRRKRKTKDDYDDEDDDDDDDEEEEDEAKVKAKAARAELKAKREELLQANQRNNGALALRNGSHICGDVGTAVPLEAHGFCLDAHDKQQRMSRKQIERQLKQRRPRLACSISRPRIAELCRMARVLAARQSSLIASSLIVVPTSGSRLRRQTRQRLSSKARA